MHHSPHHGPGLFGVVLIGLHPKVCQEQASRVDASVYAQTLFLISVVMAIFLQNTDLTAQPVIEGCGNHLWHLFKLKLSTRTFKLEQKMLYLNTDIQNKTNPWFAECLWTKE